MDIPLALFFRISLVLRLQAVVIEPDFDNLFDMKQTDISEYLKSLEKSGINLGLGEISAVMDRLGNPQNEYRSILIAGTNGKGSTAAMLSSMLSSAGLKVGLYTSPHLSDFRERIRVNNVLIDESELAVLAGESRRVSEGKLTYFEFATALAFLHFRRRGVDIAVLETGMGGRLDATNLVNPELSIITNISADHMEYLGKNLTQIAREKAGIIKKNGICITGVRYKPALAVLEETCRLRRSKLLVLRKDMGVRVKEGGGFEYRGLSKTFHDLRIPLVGSHQRDNAALALAAVEVLGEKGFLISESRIREGLAGTRWEGRLEIMSRSPLVILDGAHNPAGISALLKALAGNFSYRKLIFVFGVLKDKKYKAMLGRICRAADRVFLTTPASDRALPPEQAGPIQANTVVEKRPALALQKALLCAGPEDIVCVAGSLYLVAEIREILTKRKE